MAPVLGWFREWHGPLDPLLFTLGSVTDSAFNALEELIATTGLSASEDAGDASATGPRAAMTVAREHATEFGLHAPTESAGALLRTVAAACRAEKSSGVIAITPASAVVALYLAEGISEKHSITCIDPEVEHQKAAKSAMQQAGYGSAKARYLTSRPLDVLGRLAADSYHVIYADVAPLDMRATFDACWPLLTQGGTIIFAHSLLDATIADDNRVDRDTVAARDMFAFVNELAPEEHVVTHLPIASGLTLITRR